jgi:hypothetical protein
LPPQTSSRRLPACTTSSMTIRRPSPSGCRRSPGSSVRRLRHGSPRSRRGSRPGRTRSITARSSAAPRTRRRRRRSASRPVVWNGWAGRANCGVGRVGPALPTFSRSNTAHLRQQAAAARKAAAVARAGHRTRRLQSPGSGFSPIPDRWASRIITRAHRRSRCEPVGLARRVHGGRAGRQGPALMSSSYEAMSPAAGSPATALARPMPPSIASRGFTLESSSARASSVPVVAVPQLVRTPPAVYFFRGSSAGLM